MMTCCPCWPVWVRGAVERGWCVPDEQRMLRRGESEPGPSCRECSGEECQVEEVSEETESKRTDS